RTVVRAALRRRPEVVLTPAAKLGVRAAGLAPATTARLLAATARLLPGPDAAGEPQRSGAEVSHRLRSALVDRLTTLGDRAAARFNQPRGHGAA
ncbi:short-chain dehydrogenase, partial [Streptacidiphilus monticola]